MQIVYNARWHLSTGTSSNRGNSVIYYERHTPFRDPGLYVEMVNWKNRRAPGTGPC
jgi:hypothetical protein